MEVTTKYITIKNHIDGTPQESDFHVKTAVLSLAVEPGSNNVIVKVLYLSVDPYQINRMKRHSSTQRAVDFAVGITPGEEDLVAGVVTWGEHSIIRGGNMLRKLDPMGFPLSYNLGVLGPSGLTAYCGFFQVCKPKKGEKVFVSAASGSVGYLVGQFAKLLGCYVVGSAGSNEKVELLKEKLGFDDAFNYKEETDLKSALKRLKSPLNF
ncbi:unnamed protein product [Ilex paraguariensis]|uniref:Uncharacterized protein n=1 Tax=Ilex paraguariensis TaxID=185542 RepID=A0ABC8UA87_9AQUA